jgi:ElaB/YqjD/DUF883 family membrane-anchored ribosome-binding protein
MPSHRTSSADSESGTMGVSGDVLSERAGQAKEKVSDMARTAADTIDQRRSTAADGLETAATTLHDKADHLPGGERVSELAHGAADRLSATADYVRTHDVNRIVRDVETLVKRNPGPALAVAAVLGFLIGRSMIRD